MRSNRPRRLVQLPDVHLPAPVVAADVAVGALVVPAVGDVLVAPFPVLRVVRALPRVAARLPPLRALRVADVRRAPSLRRRVLRVVDVLVAPPAPLPVPRVRVADAVGEAARRR